MAKMTPVSCVRANGKWEVLPELPELPDFLKIPNNCFGLVSKHVLTEEEVKQGDCNDGEIGAEIEIWLGGISNKPRRKYLKNTERLAQEQYDTCILPGKPGTNGDLSKNRGAKADPVRLAALAEYYQQQKTGDEHSQGAGYEGESPFRCDLAAMLLKAGIMDNYIAEYNKNEIELEEYIQRETA